MPSLDVETLVGELRQTLTAAPFELPQPGREASRLVGWVLGLGEAQVRARGEQAVADGDAERLRQLARRRARGEPMAYLLGQREFYGRTFRVDPRVLVPRPETEHLVEAALALPNPTAPKVLDVGTGSGCLAITLALEIPGARALATDLSLGALVVCRTNARQLGARVSTVACDLGDALRLDRFDLVVSNPPYVAPEAPLSVEVRDHEPATALFADDQGRAILRSLLDQAEALRPGVPLLFEIGHDQADWLRQAIDRRPHLALRGFHRDLAGFERIVELVRR